MNKNQIDQTQFSPEKKIIEKGNVFANICIFAICYHTDKQTNKQTNKQTIYFFVYASSRSTYNTISQYLQDSDHDNDNNTNYKTYLHIGGPCTPCGKMTHKENLDQSQNHF